MLKMYSPRHATGAHVPVATREGDDFPAINSRLWDLISGVGTTENFVLHSEL
ncbi:hypothetical protein HanXRQr2_Chr11g0504811 [Helianthus annuus]|uniref:Uncharacterized protein n=1 Tax=Helianthus annuus TaxID=4232 RepID=A0A9K3N159_HELAN|nr:hypothetical protein HanXRQr2_Chr11g0504811 [Helianthus annuus]